MPQHDFTPLFARYPEVIEQMPSTFTSHEFILCLAQRCQREYIEALYAYRDSEHRGANTPFRVVHGILGAELKNHPLLIERIRTDAPSENIFGQADECAEWRRITYMLPGMGGEQEIREASGEKGPQVGQQTRMLW